MGLNPSGEMYLETISILGLKNPYVRSIDIAEHMKFSKPSVSRAVGLLKEGNFISINKDGHITLTSVGLSVAQKIYERHTVLSNVLMRLGVDEQTALEDACKIEHVISDKTFSVLKKHIEENT